MKQISFILIIFLFHTIIKADCYDDIEFEWSYVNSETQIEMEFLNNSKKTISIIEYGLKTANKEIMKNNLGSDEFLNSLTFFKLNKFGRHTKKIELYNVNKKLIKYAYFKCIYSN